MSDLAAEMGEEFEQAGDSQKLDMIRDKLKDKYGISGNHLSLVGMSEGKEVTLRDKLMFSPFASEKDVENENAVIRQRNALLKGLKGISASERLGTANIGEVAGRAYLSDTGSGRIDRLQGDLSSAERASQTYQTVSAASEAIKKSLSGLRDAGLDVGFASENMKNISIAMTKKDDVEEIIQSRASTEAKIKALRGFGIEVKSEGEIESIKKSVRIVSSGGDRTLIANLKQFRSLADAKLITQAFGNAAVGIDTSGGFSSSSLKSLKSAFTTLSEEGRSGDQFTADSARGEEALESYIREVMGEKDEKRRNELIARGGVLGTAAEHALNAPHIKGKKTVADIVKRTGLSEDVVRPILAEGGIAGDMSGTITEDVMTKLRVAMGKSHGMGVLAAESATQHASTGKDDKMLTTLDLIQKNISTSNTVMAAVAHNQLGNHKEANDLLKSISGNINQSQ